MHMCRLPPLTSTHPRTSRPPPPPCTCRWPRAGPSHTWSRSRPPDIATNQAHTSRRTQQGEGMRNTQTTKTGDYIHRHDRMHPRAKQPQTYIHTYIHTCMHTYIHTHIHAYINTYMHALHTHTSLGTQTDLLVAPAGEVSLVPPLRLPLLVHVKDRDALLLLLPRRHAHTHGYMHT
jgi:hypothetical protein